MDKIGRYEILKRVGKGGMGEVFLAFDPVCQRQVALKIIKEELSKKSSIKNRFLKEVQITSFLTHPSIVPIYSIHRDKETIYYTMLYLEGKTLQQLLNLSVEAEGNKKITPPSLKELIRLFLSLSEAVYYSHSKGVIHRDLKPDNIITGKFGETMILDWGIAEKLEEQKPPPKKLPKTVAGTLSYMAPERALGKNSSIKTEIYSLGVIFYRILTLKLPFYRKNLEHFRKVIEHEKLIDPIEVAPYRDIPKSLCEVVKKCLDTEENRYSCVSEIIEEIKNYMDGKPNWLFLQSLDINKKNDWQFQENVLLARHIAITKQIDVTEWVSMMVAKGSFSQNLKIEAKIKIKENGLGIGFLLSIPNTKKRRGLEEGYCLWLGSKNSPSIQLFKSNVLIAEVPNVYLKGKWSTISIEIEEENLHLYIDNKLTLTYTSHLPVAGTKIGLLLKDDDFTLKDLQVFEKSHKVSVNCLAVPNAFLARKDYKTALEEYRKIGHSFPGRAEGREALFRAGLTILEKAKDIASSSLYQKALDEFEKLHNTPGAPLEYLGKGMVYKAQENYSQEAICLEYCLRKYKDHSLLMLIEEYISSRLHESSLQNREAACRFSLLCLLHLPKRLKDRDTKTLLNNLESYFEKPQFLVSQKDKNLFLSIKLCFFLAREKILLELLHKTKSTSALQNGVLSLLELGHIDLAEKLIPKNSPLLFALKAHKNDPEKVLKEFLKTKEDNPSLLYHLGQVCLDKQKPKALLTNFPKKSPLYLQALLYTDNFDKADKIFSSFTKEELQQENTSIHTLYGCYLAHVEGKKAALKHFSSALESLFPSFTSLLGPFLLNKLSLQWDSQAFFFEKKELYRQLALYFHCLDNKKKKLEYLEKASVKASS
jgi:serine/threonine protein kinase